MNQSAHTVAPPDALGKPPLGTPAFGEDASNEIDAGARDTDAPPRATRFGALDIALLALAAASLGLECVLMSRAKYYWGDEIFSWTVVTDPSLRHMVSALWQAADGAPPLFYVIGRLRPDLPSVARDISRLRRVNCALSGTYTTGMTRAPRPSAMGSPAALASYAVVVGRNARPGREGVRSPSRKTAAPFTTTSEMPTGY